MSVEKQLFDRPALISNNFRGYFHKVDQTVLPFNVLTYPSQNCTIPDADKIIPDRGKVLLGQAYTENIGIIGNAEKFKTKGGEELEVRVWQSGDARGDVIEVLYNGSWITITETVNPLPVGVHEYYFDQWFDTNSNPALSKNVPRLIWVNGYEDSLTYEGAVMSWTGGIAVIDSVSPTTLSLPAGITWRSLGFTENASGNVVIVVNGVDYTVLNPSTIDTNTIDFVSTAGITAGDIATSQIELDVSPIAFDMVRVNQNYVFYGNWKQRDLYMSNAFNRPSTTVVTSSNALQDDLTIPPTSNFTGTGSHVYSVIIDTITPAIDEQTFTGTGTNNAYFDTSGYSGSGTNVYKVVAVANFAFTFVGVPAIVPAAGDILTGSVSNAVGRVKFLDSGGQDPVLELLSDNGFVPGDVISGTQGTPYGTVATAVGQIWVQTFKNGAEFTPGAFVNFVAYQFLVGTEALIDGIDFIVGTTNTTDYWTDPNVGDFWELTIQEEQPDTFQWKLDDGALSASTPITGAAQNLSNGVQILFVKTTGHQIGDKWTIQVDQAISRAWDEFYYTTPLRKIGEGYKFRLPSNFWTMNTQEKEMYVNSSFGEWGFVSTVLSGDLLSESISFTPLKQSGANKVLYPYLTGHFEDDLVYITVDKRLDFIGRKKFLELPQIANLSEPVENDFINASFVGGRLKYVDKKLFITSPENGNMLCFDKVKKYWQPPKVWPEMGLLSIVGNDLICHSNVRNQSFTMFKGDSDNGQGFEVIIRTPYTAGGNRWAKKDSTMSFIEGYITGAPQLVHTVLLEPFGCGGQYPHDVEQVVCLISDDAPLGEGSFGSHALGSDLVETGSYFREIYKSYGQTLRYFFVALDLRCTTTNHTWQLLSMGINAMWSAVGNNDIVNPDNKVQ